MKILVTGGGGFIGSEFARKVVAGQDVTVHFAAETRVDRSIQNRPGHGRYSLDITKIRKELGYEPQIPFDEGLATTIRWYRDNRDRWESPQARAAHSSGPSANR